MSPKQLDRLLDILDRAVKVVERWANAEYPEANEQIEGTISRVGDRAIPQSLEEYKQFEPQGPSEFEKRLRRGQ